MTAVKEVIDIIQEIGGIKTTEAAMQLFEEKMDKLLNGKEEPLLRS